MKDKTISHWIEAGIVLSLAVCIFSGIAAYAQLSHYARADDAYHALQEKSKSHSIPRHAPDRMPEADASPQTERSEKDFAELREESREIVGWLACEGTVIDYPLMHTDNNDFYLKHLYNGEENSSGSLFLDYRNTGAFTDRNTVIYGHNMKNGTMFKTLVSYQSQEYYDEHPTFTLYTPDGDYSVELLSGTVEDGTYEFVRFDFDSDEALLEYVDELQSRSTFRPGVQAEPGDRLVSLCTCSYEWQNARYMVVGRLVPAS